MASERGTYTITFTKGLDKASLPFEGDPARALDELNYVYRDGKVQKRFGLNEVLHMEKTYYYKVGFNGVEADSYSVNTTDWNGIWRFKAEDGKYHLIAHIGKLLYEVSEDGDGFWSASPIAYNTKTALANGNVAHYCYEFEDYKSTAVVGAKSLYFLGGNKFMRLRFKTDGKADLRPVADDADTYVPTTTISISYENAKASSRQSYDLVNLMTKWRKNMLLSGTGKDSSSSVDTEYYEYTLDGPLVCEDREEDMADFKIILKERKED